MNKILLKLFISTTLLIASFFLTVRSSNITNANDININSKSEFANNKELSRKGLIEHYANENNMSFAKAEFSLFKGSSNEEKNYKYSIFSQKIEPHLTIEFYTQNQEGSINKILNVSVKHPSKSFTGTVYMNLEGTSSIYYDIEGNILNQGTTTVSATLNISTNEDISVNIGSPNNKNIYSHVTANGRFNISNQDYRSYQYKTFLKKLADNVYLEIYTKGDGWGQYYSIEKILYSRITHPDYVFGGNMYINLEDNSNIYYSVDGAIFKNSLVSNRAYLKNSPTEKLLNIFVIEKNEQQHISNSGNI